MQQQQHDVLLQNTPSAQICFDPHGSAAMRGLQAKQLLHTILFLCKRPGTQDFTSKRPGTQAFSFKVLGQGTSPSKEVRVHVCVSDIDQLRAQYADKSLISFMVYFW